jgi:hypothetical protein
MNSIPTEIRDSTVTGAVVMWIFSLFWLGLISLMFFANLSSKHPGPIFIFIPFGLVGFLFLWLAIYISGTTLKYGRSVFRSANAPAICGGVVSGTVRIPKPFFFDQPIHLRLACTRVIQNGKNSQTITLWEDRITLDRFSRGSQVSEFPVYFEIPSDSTPTGVNRVRWSLEAKAKTQGIHYAANFAVPVQPADGSEQPEPAADPTLAFRTPAAPKRQPSDPHLHFNPLPGGGGQFEMLPGRNFGMALSLIIFGGFFGGMSFLLLKGAHHSRDLAPILFLIPFGGIGVLCILMGVRFLFLKTTITIRRGLLTIDQQAGPFSSHREYRAADIQDITSKLSGQAQSKSYYAIHGARPDGRSVSICGTIYDKSDAEWLADEFKRELLSQ